MEVAISISLTWIGHFRRGDRPPCFTPSRIIASASVVARGQRSQPQEPFHRSTSRGKVHDKGDVVFLLLGGSQCGGLLLTA